VGITLSSSSAVAAAIRAAHDVALGAYILGDRQIVGALVDAARGGAHVAVTLQADPYDDSRGGMARLNADAARVLREAGASVTLLPRSVRPFHLKAAVCDGVAFLDDRNWARDGVVLRDDDAADVVRVRDALAGRDDGDADGVALGKACALREEAALIGDAPDAPLVVATESFGPGPIATAIERRAERGAPTTLVVDTRAVRARGHALLSRLARDGVTVKASVAHEKYVLAGDAVWIGSANATYAGGELAGETDWGLVARDPALVAALRRALGATARATRSSPEPARDGGDASARDSARTACAAPA
jgi:phosphatidylserine/phosphatidylglycerophosphate/cardiolipin synthase-like enzyme